MFRKLVSNLPYSPQLIEQVGFYAQRLKQEEFARRLGMFFAMFGMILQFFVFLAPPENSLATSPNDIVYGGIANGLAGENPQGTMLRIYNADYDTRNNDIQMIFNHFGINADDIRNSTLVQISSQNKSLHSLGRENKHAADKPIRIENGTYYLRPLYVWDVINDHNVYDALKIPGRNVWIILSCGNIVVEKPTPDLSISKTGSPQANSKVKPGDTINYRMTATNQGQVGVDNLVVEDVVLINGKAADASTLTITETSASNEHNVIPGGPVPGFYENIPHAYWVWYNYAAGEQRSVNAKYIVPSNAEDGDVICNTAYIRSSGTQTKKSESVCHTVDKPVNPALQIDKNAPKNEYQVGDVFEYTVSLKNTGDTPLSDISVRDEIPSGLTLASGQKAYTASVDYLGVGQEEVLSYTVRVTKDAASSTINQVCASNSEVKRICDEATITVKRPEEETTTTEAILTPDINLSKGAKVVSASDDDPRKQDAHNSTVVSNEIIEYRLLISNSGDGEKEDFLVNEDLSDVLEYADLIDAGGGKLDDEGVISWEPRTIKSGETIEHLFRVQVKDPIPATPNSVSDPQSYDLRMDNTYGSTQIHIKVKPPSQKVVENAVKQLPRTGIGANALTTILFTGTVGYFYSRNKQLIAEIRLLRKKYNDGVKYES